MLAVNTVVWCGVVGSLELVVGAEQRGLLVVVGGVRDGGDPLRRRARRQRGALLAALAAARARAPAHHYTHRYVSTHCYNRNKPYLQVLIELGSILIEM